MCFGSYRTKQPKKGKSVVQWKASKPLGWTPQQNSDVRAVLEGEVLTTLNGASGLPSETRQCPPLQGCCCSFTPLFLMQRALLGAPGCGEEQLPFRALRQGGFPSSPWFAGWDMAPCCATGEQLPAPRNLSPCFCLLGFSFCFFFFPPSPHWSACALLKLKHVRSSGNI